MTEKLFNVLNNFKYSTTQYYVHVYSQNKFYFMLNINKAALNFSEIKNDITFSTTKLTGIRNKDVTVSLT